MSSEYAVFLGLDVGKGEHHACALDPSGKKLHDKALPNDEQRLRALFSQLGKHGKVLVVVGQPASIGALPVAVAVACLPGLTMRRLAGIHPGSARTDARDAFVIADAARTLPHTLRRVDAGDETLAELEVLTGFDDDLTGEATRLANRIRGLPVTIHPALEKALGSRLSHPAALKLLTCYGGPDGLRAAGRDQLLATARPLAPRLAGRLAGEILSALDAQTVVVPGTSAAETVLPHLARSLASVHDQRKQVAAQVEEILDALPLARVLISMPGFGIRTSARVLLEIGDIAAFPAPGHLAAYAGLAPITRRSGTSIHGEEHPPKGGSKALKRAMFLAAFASLSNPLSRACYDRKRAEGKKHNAALTCLARRRSDVIYAMLRDHHPYQAPAKTQDPERSSRWTKPIGPPRIPCLRTHPEDHLHCPFPQLTRMRLPRYHEPQLSQRSQPPRKPGQSEFGGPARMEAEACHGMCSICSPPSRKQSSSLIRWTTGATQAKSASRCGICLSGRTTKA